MKRLMTAWLAAWLLAGAAGAAAPAPAGRAQRLEAREAIRAHKLRLKRVGADARKEHALLRERETSDLRLARASAARGEALHLLLLEIREKSRRDRLALRARARADRERLRRVMKNERDRLIALRQKK